MSISRLKTRARPVVFALTATVVLKSALAGSPPVTDPPTDAQLRQEWCQHWSMESRVAKAQLVLVARVSNISEVNIVRGAKVNTALREYRFQPVSVLKGVFTRDELAMTDSDLGLPAPDPTAEPPFKHGEHLLLILTRTAGTFGCVGLPQGWNNPRQLIPRLVDDEDPIVSMTRTLIEVSQSPSRQRRVELSIAKLGTATGPSVVPLLLSVGSRGYWVQEPGAARILADLTTSNSPAVRAAAARTISRVLASGAPIDDAARTTFAGSLLKLLESKAIETELRVAALRGLGRMNEFGRKTDWIGKLLVDHLHTARTNAERNAAVVALGELKDPRTTGAVLKELGILPLDEHKARESLFVSAAVRLAGNAAAPVLRERLQQKLDAGHAAFAEISQLGQLGHREAMPELIRAAVDGKHRDEIQLSDTFKVLGDERAVPVLGQWLASVNANTRWAALRALDAIDSKTGVAAIRLRLKSEPDLRLKLHMAAVLGRHGITDGYAFALEHLADPGITPYAAKALAAINDSHTSGYLWKIVETSHDVQWSGAALHGLAALRDPKIRARLVKDLSDRRNPLLLAAITAARELSDPALIPAVAPHLLSRNYTVANLSISAVRHLAIEAQNKEAHRDGVVPAGTTLLEVLNDPDIHMNLRIAALDALQSLKDNRLAQTLKALADRSRLENTELIVRIDKALTTL